MCFLNQCKCNWLPQCRVKRSSQFSRRHTIGIYFKSNREWLNSLVLAGGNYLVPNFNLRCWRRGDQRSRVPGGKRTGFHLKLTYYSPKCKLVEYCLCSGPHHRGIRARLSTMRLVKDGNENLVDYCKKTQNASNIKCSVYLTKAALRIAKVWPVISLIEALNRFCCWFQRRTYKLNSVLMFSSSEIYRQWLLCAEILSTTRNIGVHATYVVSASIFLALLSW